MTPEEISAKQLMSLIQFIGFSGLVTLVSGVAGITALWLTVKRLVRDTNALFKVVKKVDRDLLVIKTKMGISSEE